MHLYGKVESFVQNILIFLLLLLLLIYIYVIEKVIQAQFNDVFFLFVKTNLLGGKS